MKVDFFKTKTNNSFRHFCGISLTLKCRTDNILNLTMLIVVVN